MRVVKRKINDSTIATPFEGSQPRDFDQSRYTYFLVYALYSPTPRRPVFVIRREGNEEYQFTQKTRENQRWRPKNALHHL